MITREAMFEPLLAVCPTFQPAWDEFLAEWQEEEGGLPLYLALGDLSRHVIALIEKGDTEAVRSVFHVVEAWHTDGDEYVREAATVGFLETLGSNLEDSSVSPSDVRARLGRESATWWHKLDRFWAGDGGALSDDGETGRAR